MPDTVGPSLAAVDADALLAATRSEVETSILTGNRPSTLATVIPASPVRPIYYWFALNDLQIVLRIKVESSVKIRAIALAAGAALLNQAIGTRMSVYKLDQLQGQCRIRDVDSALGDIWPIGQQVLKLLSFKRL